MRKIHFSRATLLHCLLLFSASFCAAEDVKKIHPSGYVSDLAGVIAPEARTRLEALCTEVEQKTGAQMAIVTVQSLDGEGVENYAVDLFKQLGVGSKKDNRGVLLLVAPHEHKYRIEVGYGLEPILPDGKVGGFGREAVPQLRNGNYGGALLLLTTRIAEVIANDAGVQITTEKPTAPTSYQEQPHPGVSGGTIILVIIVILIVLFTPLRRLLFWWLLFGGGGGWG